LREPPGASILGIRSDALSPEPAAAVPPPLHGGGIGVGPTQTTATRLLGELQRGSDTAVDQLFTLLYEELSEIAHRQRQRWHDDYTLDTTALVHEAYLKLAGPAGAEAESRAHFLALAARAMRHILCNYARDRRTRKRGGVLERLPLHEAASLPDPATASDELAGTLVSLDEALKRLEQIDPRQSKVVECRFFGGLTVEETAAAIGVSPRTVKRDWAVAQAWLHCEMTAGV
jgi:RNA polymerase sigma factor (TIGR02999 family)